MNHRAMKRLLALRAMEQERVEADLARQRRLQHVCEAAYAASVERTEAAAQALHSALTEGDRDVAMAAELALVVGPLERRALNRRILQIRSKVANITAEWNSARVRREQMQTLASGEQVRIAGETLRREQKSLDDWFRVSQIRYVAGEERASREDENFPRKLSQSVQHDGMPCAEGVAE